MFEYNYQKAQRELFGEDNFCLFETPVCQMLQKVSFAELANDLGEIADLSKSLQILHHTLKRLAKIAHVETLLHLLGGVLSENCIELHQEGKMLYFDCEGTHLKVRNLPAEAQQLCAELKKVGYKFPAVIEVYLN